MPLLTRRLTLAPVRRCRPWPGVCEITWPVFTFFEKLCLTAPVRQCARLIIRRAAVNVLPFVFGAMQAGADCAGASEKVAVTVLSADI